MRPVGTSLLPFTGATLPLPEMTVKKEGYSACDTNKTGCALEGGWSNRFRLRSFSRRLWKLPGLQLPGTSCVHLPLALLKFTQADAQLGCFIPKCGPICGEGFFRITLVRVVCHSELILRAPVFWSASFRRSRAICGPQILCVGNEPDLLALRCAISDRGRSTLSSSAPGA